MSRSAGPPKSQLHRGHFAFMRAVCQGLDERQSWDRYLRLEGEQADARQVRRTIASIRDAFAAAARREQRPGTARLILLDPDRLSQASALPTLAEFAAAEGLEDFSEAEQVEAYEAAHPGSKRAGQGGAPAAAARRARIIGRQLEALRWLERLVARDPRPEDAVGGWLNPAVAARLERAGLPTLAALVACINTEGARWWRAVPGVGAGKAARILDWLVLHESELGITVAPHGRQARRSLPRVVLASVVPAGTGLLPYEKLRLPEHLSGRHGRFRAPLASCRLQAADDHAAIGVWLRAPRRGAEAPTQPEAPLSSTQRAYRREAERLLLWAVLERGVALSSLGAEDAAAYCDFVAAPPPAWCGPRHHQRWSPRWRPLEGPLRSAALGQTLAILRSLFNFLVGHGYLLANPFADAQWLSPRPPRTPRSLNQGQWDHVNACLDARGEDEPMRRLRRGMRWVHATGLRISELTAARCGDLQRVDGAGMTAPEPGWQLCVPSRNSKSRHVLVPSSLVAELQQELTRHGLDPDPGAAATRRLAILARFASSTAEPPAWSNSGFSQGIKRLLGTAIDGVDELDATCIRKASAHWLRNVRPVDDAQDACGRPASP